ncbi:MAG: quinoprotein relay system zinc metallohydrolase 1 [Thiolinea sp.]
MSMHFLTLPGRLLAIGLCCLGLLDQTTAATTAADPFDYHLKPQQVAEDTYVFIGKTEDFSRKNGGYIVNTGFIVTTAGVIVIDSGPSRRFAEQQRAAIATVTDQPILRVYLTHHHPDHFLGDQVYADVPQYALAATRAGIQTEGEMFSDNMYRMVGDWMRGTRVTLPDKSVKVGVEEVGGHRLEFFAMKGHTPGDLVIFDHTTGVLFSGDLVFNQRAATTPHATLDDWLQSLQHLKELPFKVLVPGHGAVATDQAPIVQTRDYLEWLAATLQEGAESGMDMAEIMQSPIPERFQTISLVREELQRSVSHWFPALEDAVLKPVTAAE